MVTQIWRHARKHPQLMIRLVALAVTVLAVLALIGAAIAALA